MASNDTPDLAGINAEDFENLSEGMSSTTEAGLGVVSTLTNISSLLDSIAKNPLLSVGAFRTIDHYLDKYLIAKLKDAGIYTEKLDKMINKTSRDMAIWTTTMAGVSSALYSIGNAQSQLLKSTREVSKFATMENLPGGAAGLPGAAANLKYLEAEMGAKYTSEFARNYVNQYSRLFSQLQKGTDMKAVQDIVGLYSYQSGLDVAGIASNLLNNYRGIGLTSTGAIQAVVQPMMQQMTSRFAYGSIDQVMNSFLQMFQKQISLTGGDVNTAYQQSMGLMKGLGKDFGLNEMSQLQNLYLGPGRTNEMIKRAALLPGVNFNQLQQSQGGAGGLINTVSLMQQGVRNILLQNAPQLKGTDLQESLKGKTYTDVLTSMGGRKVFETFTEMFGLTPELAFSLARMKDINTNIKDIVTSMDDLNISTENFVSTISSSETTKSIKKVQDQSTTLLDKISNWMLEKRTDVGKMASGLGVEPALFEGAGASLLIGTVLWGLLRKYSIYRGATKSPKMMGGAALPIIGGMDVLREAHEGGDMGQGVMNAVTDVATFSLMNKMLGGSKRGASTISRAGKLGKLGKLGKFGLPLAAAGIVLTSLIENSKSLEEAEVENSLRIHPEDPELQRLQGQSLYMYNTYKDTPSLVGHMPVDLKRKVGTGGIENTIENISKLSRLESLKEKAKSGGSITDMINNGEFGTLNIVVTTPDGETIASEQMERFENKRIMISLKGVLG